MDFFFIGGIALVAFGSLLFSKGKSNNKKIKNKTVIKEEVIEKDKLVKEFLDYIENIINQKINKHIWISVEEIIDINEKYTKVYGLIKKQEIKTELEKKFINLFEYFFIKNGEKIKLEEQVLFINKKYIDQELKNNKELFDNIDGKSLDSQQRLAAIIDDNKLIVAGAGSGKTLTVAGTVKYLVESKNVNPKDILLITYTKKAAEEMKDRIIQKLNIDVDVYTFHALGNKIIKETEPIKQSVLEDDYNKKFFEFIKKDESFLLKVIQYNLSYKQKNIEANNIVEHMFNENMRYREIIESKEPNVNFTDEELEIIERVEKRNIFIKDKDLKDFELISYSNNIEDRYSRKDLKTLKEFFAKAYYKNKEERLYEYLNNVILKSDEYNNILKKIEENKEAFKSFNHEIVKSNEEILIANYLFRNNIKYQYEYPYKFNTANSKYRQYRPDFYLPEYDIYIEHFGINRKGETPQYSPEEEKVYLEGIKWKRKIHKEKNTKLIESYSYEFSEGLFPKSLHDKLEKEGVKFNPIPKEKIEKFAENMEKEIKNKNSVFKQFLTFLNLLKSNNYKYEYLNEIESKIISEKNNSYSFMKNKELFFIDIVKDLYFIYENFLKEQQCIDFADMITKAINDLEKYDKTYKYIIIDEYQDTSKVRCDLITALKEKNDICKIMVVGDDWQSIYRFAGNDLNLFIHFDKYLGAGLKLNIEKTYRNSQELVNIASKFIMKNSMQIKKDLKSFKELKDNPIKGVGYREEHTTEIRYDKNGEQYEISRETNLSSFFDLIIDDIKRRNPTAKTVMILSRYKFDMKLIYNELDFEKIKNKNKNEKTKVKYKDSDLEFTTMTIHGSKGLEADEVILLINDKEYLGFPSKIQDDPIFRFVLSEKENFPYAEERRLFYVATTRTRNRVYIIYNIDSSSEFVSELVNEKSIEVLNQEYIDKTNKAKREINEDEFTSIILEEFYN